MSWLDWTHILIIIGIICGVIYILNWLLWGPFRRRA